MSHPTSKTIREALSHVWDDEFDNDPQGTAREILEAGGWANGQHLCELIERPSLEALARGASPDTMPNTEHPALVALRDIRDITGSTGGPGDMIREFTFRADRAIPALEALITERDRLLAGLRWLVAEMQDREDVLDGDEGPRPNEWMSLMVAFEQAHPNAYHRATKKEAQ